MGKKWSWRDRLTSVHFIDIQVSQHWYMAISCLSLLMQSSNNCSEIAVAFYNTDRLTGHTEVNVTKFVNFCTVTKSSFDVYRELTSDISCYQYNVKYM